MNYDDIRPLVKSIQPDLLIDFAICALIYDRNRVHKGNKYIDLAISDLNMVID